jgi:gamma-tubulin complex component 2
MIDMNVQITDRILTTCSQYTQFTSSFARYIQASDPDLAGKATGSTSQHRSSQSTGSAYDPSKLDKLEEGLRMFEHNFSRHLKILLDTLNYLAATETVVFLSLCARLSAAGEGGATQVRLDA